MRQRRVATCVLCALVALSLSGAWSVPAKVLAQGFGGGQARLSDTDRQIITEIQQNSEVMKNLQYMTDMIGPRLTGTDKMTKASNWTMEMFTKYGLSNAHLEGFDINFAWYRGPSTARVVAPVEQRLWIEAAGWSPATTGKMRGPVMFVEARNAADLEKYRGKLKNAVVVTAAPGRLPTPYERPRSPLEAPEPAAQLPAANAPPAGPGGGGGGQQFGATRDAFFKAEGVGIVLRDSVKDGGLINMTGIGGREFNKGAIPTAFASPETYRLLWRLLQRGPVEVEYEIQASFSPGPVKVYNTVAELPGTEKPDEVVIIGGHLDSWDLGTGATDDGTGTMAVLEAARALAKLGLKPKRTIRFIMFTGEEEGLVGSRKYVEAHKAELDKIVAVLVHDTGTGRVQSIGLQSHYAVKEAMDRLMAPYRVLGLGEISTRGLNGTDHASFAAAGVPGFYCIQDPAEYNRKTHHTQADTFDAVWADHLIQGSQILALWAYKVANMDGVFPRAPIPPQQQRPADPTQ